MCLFTVRRIIALLLISFLSLPFVGAALAHSAAPDWIKELRNGENTSCCGQEDCTAVASIDLLNTKADTALIVINGTIITQVYKMSLVPVSCEKRPHVCLQKSITQEGEERPCAWKKEDGSIGILPTPRCIRCAVIPYCPS